MLMKPILEVRNLTKIYEGGVLANHEVNFSVEEGEIHALVGENGSMAVDTGNTGTTVIVTIPIG